MKAISLTQPWATLVAIGAKTIETRSWATSYRGPLAIHAAKGLGPVGGKRKFWELEQSSPFFFALRGAGMPNYDRYPEGYPFGAIVAVCQLFDCLPAEDVGCIDWKRWQYPATDKAAHWHMTDQERAFGDYSPGRYAWLLGNIRALAEPVPCAGKQRLWELDAQTLIAVEQQLRLQEVL